MMMPEISGDVDTMHKNPVPSTDALIFLIAREMAGRGGKKARPSVAEREQQNGCACAVVQRRGSPHDRTVGMLRADAMARPELL